MIGFYTMEEMTQFASHGFRPVVPGNPAHLPEGVGYAEAMNAGKSRYNEDQVRSILIIQTRAIEGFLGGTFRTNSRELNFSRTTFFCT